MTKILVVDDSRLERKMLQDALRSLNYLDVVYTSDYDEAINAFSKNSFDIVILDILMPGKDGFDVLKKISHMNPRIKVLMLSSLDQDEYKDYSEDLGASAYLTKPFRIEELERVLRDMTD